MYIVWMMLVIGMDCRRIYSWMSTIALLMMMLPLRHSLGCSTRLSLFKYVYASEKSRNNVGCAATCV